MSVVGWDYSLYSQSSGACSSNRESGASRSVPDQYRYTDFSHASLHAGCDRRTSEGLEEDITSVRTSSDKYSDRGVESSFAGILSGRSRLLFHGDFGLYLFCNDCNIYIIEYCSYVPDSLISSIGTTMVLAGAYVNQENPAMKELTQYVKLLAEGLRRRGYYSEILTKDYMSNLLKAAPMHDVGKIAVPDAILQKPGRLTPEEFEIMKLHAQKGGEIIQESFGRMGNEQYLRLPATLPSIIMKNGMARVIRKDLRERKYRFVPEL